MSASDLRGSAGQGMFTAEPPTSGSIAQQSAGGCETGHTGQKKVDFSVSQKAKGLVFVPFGGS